MFFQALPVFPFSPQFFSQKLQVTASGAIHFSGRPWREPFLLWLELKFKV
jgi:hypothetical protein